MPEGKDVPVILRLYHLMLWTMNHVARFPRHQPLEGAQGLEAIKAVLEPLP
jgi:hypothetical protein